DSDSLEGQQYHFAKFAVRGTQSGTARPTGSVVVSSAPAGPSGPGETLGRGKGRGEASVSYYAYPHPRIFELDRQRVIEPPAGSTLAEGLSPMVDRSTGLRMMSSVVSNQEIIREWSDMSEPSWDCVGSPKWIDLSNYTAERWSGSA
ncbi:hypothetical protein HAX54_029279, partial [Datura stramonium]|nr:hypothetical protein [Datura stramonium]